MKNTPSPARQAALAREAERRAAFQKQLEGVRAIREAASHGDDASLLIQIAGETGARLGEITDAQWPDFALANGVPTWTIPRGKTGPRVEKLTPAAARAIELLASRADPASQRVFPKLAHPRIAIDRYRRFAERHGLGHVRFHDIREEWWARTGGG